MSEMYYGIHSKGDSLVKGDEEITNFSVESPQKFYSPGENVPAMLRISINHLGELYVVDLDLTETQLTRQIQRYIPTCKVLRDKQKIDAYILELSRSEDEGKERQYCFQRHGLEQIKDGRWVFVCGDEVLGLTEGTGYAVFPQTARAHLAWDPAYPIEDAVQGFCKVLERHDQIYLPIWGFTIVSSMRSCINQLDISTFPSLAAIGGQGFGKTTALRRLGLLYDDREYPGRIWGELDARSTSAATIEMVSQYRDQVVLIDDLAKSASRSEVTKRTMLVSDVLRFASNSSSRVRMCANQREDRYCQAGLAFTGEFYLKNASDVTRMIAVELCEQMDGGKPEDRVLAATVFHHMMLWLLQRMDTVLEDLRQQLNSILSVKYPRLQKSHRLVSWAIGLFYQFAQETGAITEQYRSHAVDHSKEIMDVMLRRQIQRSLVKSFCQHILDGYKHDAFSIVSRKRIRTDKDCILEDDALCIRTQTLLTYLRDASGDPSLTKAGMAKQLRRENLIISHKEGRLATKRINRMRYIELPLKLLQRSAGKA